MTHPPPADEPQGALALVIQPNGAAELIRLPVDDLARSRKIHDLIGGYYEAIGTREWIAYTAEDERQFPDGLLPNLYADAMARTLGCQFYPGDYAKGVLVFVGRHGVDEADVPQRVLDLAHAARLT